MGLTNTVTIKDENGYREEVWSFRDYDKMQDTLDQQLADGLIDDWWIAD